MGCYNPPSTKEISFQDLQKEREFKKMKNGSFTSGSLDIEIVELKKLLGFPCSLSYHVLAT
jgi:hypothetical protein